MVAPDDRLNRMNRRFDRALLPAIATVVVLLTLLPSHVSSAGAVGGSPPASQADSQAAIFAEAIAAARQIDDAEPKVFALCEIASAQANARLTDDARRTLTEAFKIAVDLDYAENNSAGMDERARPLWSIAVDQADAGFFAEALATAQKIASPRGKAEALFMVASAQAQAGLVADAPVRPARSPTKPREVIPCPISRRRRQRQGAMARPSARSANLNFKMCGRCECARSPSPKPRQGSRDQARELFAEMLATALGIKDGFRYDKLKSLYDVAVSQAEAGLTMEALETARQIDDDTGFRISALCRIAAVQAKANEAEQARRTVSDAIGIVRKIQGRQREVVGPHGNRSYPSGGGPVRTCLPDPCRGDSLGPRDQGRGRVAAGGAGLRAGRMRTDRTVRKNDDRSGCHRPPHER